MRLGEIVCHCENCVSNSWQSLSFCKPKIATNSTSSRGEDLTKRSVYLKKSLVCHSSESCNLEKTATHWMPAFAGMTTDRTKFYKSGTVAICSKSLILLIKIYKYLISPLLPASCRFTPTCSEYAAQAIKQYGTVKGGVLAAKRICRCNPFSGAKEITYDPVP